MAEKYFGVPIPDDLWEGWSDPNNSEVFGFRRGVRLALRIVAGSKAARTEEDRLEALAETRDAAETAAFEEKHKDEPWMQRRVAFRRVMEEGKTDGAS